MSGEQEQAATKKHLQALLRGGEAHVTFADAVANLDYEQQGRVPSGLPYSPWQLLEHMRLAQDDILRFSANTDGSYQPMKWPDDYWPSDAAPPSAESWQESVEAILRDRAAFEQLVQRGDLFAPFPWGEGQTLMREALLIASHESYHLGELLVTRRLLGAWKPKAGHK